jgi:5-methyltetrahydrofolate--homocysteine methyltransferase
MFIIGESLNGTIPSVGKAIAARDTEFVTQLALRQAACGAQMLDVNAGGAGDRDQCADLAWLVQTVQAAVPIPLVLDCADPAALRAALSVYRGPRPILSSVGFDEGPLDTMLGMAVEYDCGLVALCMSGSGIPKEPEERLSIAARLVERAAAAGLKLADLYLDPLVMTLAADYNAGQRMLETLRRVRERFPEVSTVCGVSNIGFEMPQRRLLNRTFVAMLMALGIEAFMVDVRDGELMAALLAAAALAGRDPWCRSYLKAYRAGVLGPVSAAKK